MKYNAIGTRENIKIIDQAENKGMKVEVLEYQKLMGGKNTYSAERMFYMEQQNIKARQIAVYLNNDTVKIEPGAMSYFCGNIEMVSGVNAGNFIGRAITGKLTGEAMAQPEYRGT